MPPMTVVKRLVCSSQSKISTQEINFTFFFCSKLFSKLHSKVLFTIALNSSTAKNRKSWHSFFQTKWMNLKIENGDGLPPSFYLVHWHNATHFATSSLIIASSHLATFQNVINSGGTAVWLHSWSCFRRAYIAELN